MSTHLRKSTDRNACVNCHADVGPGTKVIPFSVNEDGGQGGGKPETWCPTCFVTHRAILEPQRFHPGRYAAIHCNACGFTSVDAGMGCCNQCRSKSVLLVMNARQLGVVLKAHRKVILS